MPEDANTPLVDPHAGDTETPQPDAATKTTTDPHAGDSQEDMLSLAEARKIRSESTNLRQRLKDAEKLASELKTFKEQTEAEKLTTEQKQELTRQNLEKQLADLQEKRENAVRQTQELRVTNEVFKHGQKLNIVDLDAAQKLLDASQIEYDDSGSPVNIEALLKTLVKERTWLVSKQQAQTSGGATNPSRSTSSSQQLSWEAISEMAMKDPSQYRARREEIQQWMSSNPGPR